MYPFFNREKEPFRMEKGRSLVTNIDRKGKWRPDTGGDKRKEWEKEGKACFYRENTIKEKKSGSLS